MVVGLIQLAAQATGFAVVFHIPIFFGYVIGFFLTWIPLVGTAAGVYGAHVGWGWSWLSAILLFGWPTALILSIAIAQASLGSLVTGLSEKQARKQNDRRADDVAAFGRLVAQYPTAIIDASRLPRPKPEMKKLLTWAWDVRPDMRNAIEENYISLARFQNGVGPQPIDCSVAPTASPEQAVKVLQPYLKWSATIEAEENTLLAELKSLRGA